MCSMRCGRRVGILLFTLSILAVAALCGSVSVSAADLTVDTSVGNSPYNVTTSIGYDNESVGVSPQGGIMNQSGYTNTVNNALSVGLNGGASGTYNLGGTGAIQMSGTLGLPETTVTTGFSFEYVGSNGGAGTFNQTGGTNTIIGGEMFVGSDIFSGSGKGSTGVYNLSGGSILISKLIEGSSNLEGSGAELIGDSGGNGTFNQTGGYNLCNNGVFIGSDGAWRLAGTLMTGSTGVYNLSGAGSVLNTGGAAIVGDSADGGEVVGDGGGTGTFNQFSGTNIATDGGLAVGSDVYGSGVGGVGVFNLGGGGLVASGLPQAVGGEVIGTCRGIGTFNQTGGTNTVLAGLFVGSNINYSLSPSPIVPVGGTGVYNLSGGALTAQGGSAVYYGPTVFVPGESIGEGGGTGTFNQRGGTNTVTDGLCVGTDLFQSSEGPGAGAYNLSGGALNAVGNGTPGSADFMPGETIGDGGGTGKFTQTGGTNTVTGGLYVGSDILGNGTAGVGSYNLYGGVLRADFEYVGGGGAGTFAQTGGSNTVSGSGAEYGIEMNGGTYHLNGGTLSANSIDGNLDNEGGTFIPSKAGSVFTGNYTQGKNSVLQIGIASADNYTWLDMANTGKATFNGGTIAPVLQGGFVPDPGQTFDVIMNAQSITGAPTVANFTATLVGVEENLADPGIAIGAVRDYANSALTLTQNQQQVGNMLNKVSGTTTGDLGTVLHAIDSIPTSQANSVANVYQQISPDMAASLANLGFAASAYFRQDLSERITSLRYAGLADENPGVAGGECPALAMDLGGASALQGAGSRAAGQVNGWNFYADPQVFWGSQGSTANQTGYNFSIGGLTAGADYRVRDDLLVGVAGGYGHTDAGFYNNLGNVQNDTVPVNLYAAYFPGCFYAFGSAGYAVNLFSTNRQIAFIDRTATGSTTGNMFNGYGEAGYDLRAGNVVLTPMASLAYSSLWINGFGETGAGSLDLNVGSQHADSLQLGPGVRLASAIKCGQAVVAPQLYASYEHEFSNDSRGIDANLAQAGVPFGFQSQRLGTDFGMLGASITLFSGKNFSVRLDSNAEIGRANYSACMVDAGLSFRF